MDDMLHHIKTVVRGTEKAHIIGDMPFMSYHADVSEAIRNAGRILKEGGAQSVKLEGGQEMAETVNRIVKSGIPVMGHVGLTPQSVNQLGGYRVQGRTINDAIGLMEDTRALEEAGAYAVVLECVPAALSQMITDRLRIPTIGIGAGVGCDGQVQVLHDFLGLFTDHLPKHARRYANLAESIQEAASQYISDVHLGEFPSAKESFKMSQSVLNELRGEVFKSA
jgi:3-methyl-2-oxobutanoate hydroxymethyltransferase